MRELRRIACEGIPDAPSIRSMVWKVLLLRTISFLFSFCVCVWK